MSDEWPRSLADAPVAARGACGCRKRMRLLGHSKRRGAVGGGAGRRGGSDVLMR